MTSKEFINSATVALLIIFNAGIVFRSIKILMDSQHDETIDPKKQIMKYIIAFVVVNALSGLAIAIKHYYT